MKLLINEYEYELLTDSWRGPAGAAYNACWEYCHENGLIGGSGRLTLRGEEQVALFKEVKEKVLDKVE